MTVKVVDLSSYQKIPSDKIGAEIRTLALIYKTSLLLQVSVLPEDDFRARVEALIRVANDRGEGSQLVGIFGDFP